MRALVPMVLQCSNCKAFGHVMNVCREMDMSDYFEKEDDVECLNCDGKYLYISSLNGQ